MHASSLYVWCLCEQNEQRKQGVLSYATSRTRAPALTPSSPIPRVTKVSSAERKATSGRGGEIFSVSVDFYIALYPRFPTQIPSLPRPPPTPDSQARPGVVGGLGRELVVPASRNNQAPPDEPPPEGRGESPLWLAQASKLAPAHALCGTILATILHLRSHRRATMSAGVSPRRRAASSLAKRDR